MRVCGGGWRAAVGIVLAGLVVLPALAACSAAGGARASASPSPSGMTDAQLQVLVNNLVQCIRRNGAPGMPDVPVRNGHAVVPDRNSVDQATQRNFDAAVQACQALRERIPPAVLGESSGDRQGPTAADVPKLRQFAKCMREHGVPEWPDPKADGSFPSSAPITAEGKSPRIVAGFQACRQYWDGGLRFS